MPIAADTFFDSEHLGARPQPGGVLRRRLLARDRVLGLQGCASPHRRSLARLRWRRCSGSCRRSSGRSSTSSFDLPTRSRSGAIGTSRTELSRSGSPSAISAAPSAAARSRHRSSSAPSARPASSRRAARAARRSSRSGRPARTARRPCRPTAVLGERAAPALARPPLELISRTPPRASDYASAPHGYRNHTRPRQAGRRSSRTVRRDRLPLRAPRLRAARRPPPEGLPRPRASSTTPSTRASPSSESSSRSSPRAPSSPSPSAARTRSSACAG